MLCIKVQRKTLIVSNNLPRLYQKNWHTRKNKPCVDVGSRKVLFCEKLTNYKVLRILIGMKWNSFDFISVYKGIANPDVLKIKRAYFVSLNAAVVPKQKKNKQFAKMHYRNTTFWHFSLFLLFFILLASRHFLLFFLFRFLFCVTFFYPLKFLCLRNVYQKAIKREIKYLVIIFSSSY